MKHKKLIFVAIATAVFLASVVTVVYTFSKSQSVNQTLIETNYRILSPQQVNDQLKNKNFFMLNVHTPYEGEIAGTDIFIPYNSITENISKLPQDKAAKILVYCRTGRMSTIAVQKLAELGYTNIYELSGGMDAWQKQGYEVLSNP